MLFSYLSKFVLISTKYSYHCHRLGVGDDYEGQNSKVCYSGIMRRGVWQDHDWSVCAVQTFERWAGAKISDCISRHETDTLDDKTTPPVIPGIDAQCCLCKYYKCVCR